MKISIIAAPFQISHSIKKNLDFILGTLSVAAIDDFVVFPECSLTGYSESDEDFPISISFDEVNLALIEIKTFVCKNKLHTIFGSLTKEDGNIFNSGIFYSYSNSDFVYHKINLAIKERKYIFSGDSLSGFDVNISGEVIKVAIQLCREIRFPEQWKYLAISGSKVFFYLTYTTGSAIDVWRSHLISRAAENQRFLVAVNVAATNQQCPTMIIAPNGEVIDENISNENIIIRKTIDVSTVSDWFIAQSRTDIVGIYGKKT